MMMDFPIVNSWKSKVKAQEKQPIAARHVADEWHSRFPSSQTSNVLLFLCYKTESNVSSLSQLQNSFHHSWKLVNSKNKIRHNRGFLPGIKNPARQWWSCSESQHRPWRTPVPSHDCFASSSWLARTRRGPFCLSSLFCWASRFKRLYLLFVLSIHWMGFESKKFQKVQALVPGLCAFLWGACIVKDVHVRMTDGSE